MTWLARFRQIGRQKASWNQEFLIAPTPDDLAMAVQAMNVLMSSDVAIAITGDRGTVYAGMRAVGHVEIVEMEAAK